AWGCCCSPLSSGSPQVERTEPMPDPGPVAERELLAGYPPVRPILPEDVRPTAGEVLVVLDDDPTGTQPVAGLPVLTRWREEDLAWALDGRAERPPAVYVLTNS